MMEERLAAHYPMGLFFNNLKTGQKRVIHAAPTGSAICSFRRPTPTC